MTDRNDQERPSLLWNRAVTHQPAVVRRCRTVDDVRRAIHHARTQGLDLSVLGGGHDWAGRAVRQGGLVIDLGGMRTVQVENGVATLGGGATTLEVVNATSPAGLVPATGTVGAVGLTGLTLGGGYGPLNGIAGLAADNLLGAEVVLADGSVVATDADHEPDLLWALRGGGGNFGVVTSMRVCLHPYATVYGGAVTFPWAQATDVLAGYGALAAEAPDELTMPVGILSGPDGSPMVTIYPTWAGDSADGAAWVKRIEALGVPVDSMIGTMPYADILRQGDQMFTEAPVSCNIRTRNLGGLTEGVVADLVAAGDAGPGPIIAVNMHHFHGTASRVAVPATAVGTREDHFMAEIIAAWSPGQRSDDLVRWMTDTDDLLARHALPGGYPNMLGASAHVQIAEAYGPNASRLRNIKALYDPDGVFTAIPLPL